MCCLNIHVQITVINSTSYTINSTFLETHVHVITTSDTIQPLFVSKNK